MRFYIVYNYYDGGYTVHGNKLEAKKRKTDNDKSAKERSDLEFLNYLAY